MDVKGMIPKLPTDKGAVTTDNTRVGNSIGSANEAKGANTPNASGAVSFQETLSRLQNPGALQSVTRPAGASATVATGAATAEKAMKAQDALAVKFSNHAVERMQTRGISYTQDQLAKLNEAVAKAKAKGAKDSLVLMDDSALIVSVKNNTVVTVMDKQALKENVFTNIDSTIVM